MPPASVLPSRHRRLRRWSYAAFAGEDVSAGAAVVDLGYVGAAFAWVLTSTGLVTWEDRRLLARGVSVGSVAEGVASWRSRDAEVVVQGDGGFRVVLRARERPVRLEVAARDGGCPATLVTDTAGGGWNVTEKEAGYRVDASLRTHGGDVAVAGLGWRDRTVGRQDRQTSWMWAAGAGTVAGRRLGLNVSTGMNAAGPGEDLVWWDGCPQALQVKELLRGEDLWRLRGPGWSLRFRSDAVRSADERLGPVRSRYVQPIGTFSGTLPGPSGSTVEVPRLHGVTEEHEARW